MLEMLDSTTNRSKVIMGSEITSNSIKITTFNKTQIMHVALEMILETAIKKEVFLIDANLGTMIDSRETIGHDHEIERKVKSNRPNLRIGTFTLQITGRVILG